MIKAFERLREEVRALAGKYSGTGKRRELEEVFSRLEREIRGRQLQGQRLMTLLREIIFIQPGSEGKINEFLKSPGIARALHGGGTMTLK